MARCRACGSNEVFTPKIAEGRWWYQFRYAVMYIGMGGAGFRIVSACIACGDTQAKLDVRRAPVKAIRRHWAQVN
ncbi:MAG: hypothetical protein HYT80_05980 [Euryarchaeota archaeon]|nr:hypothetical protein [Euryarchaeota archaeon]